MHTDPEIIALLALGEPAGSDSDREHLAGCAACRATLDAFTAAAAAGRSTASAPMLVAPHERVWEEVAAAVRAESAEVAPMAGVPTPVASAPPVAPAPVESAPVASAPVASAPVEPAPRRLRSRSGVRSRRSPARWFALAAALVLAAAVGGVATSTLLRPGTTPGDGVSVLAKAALTALPDWPGASGDAVVEKTSSGTSMVISVNAATDRPDTYREVWLLSSDLTQLVSLGLLSGDSGTFAIPADIDMSRYSIVDVSSEPLDGNPAHSSNSIVRGSLAS